MFHASRTATLERAPAAALSDHTDNGRAAPFYTAETATGAGLVAPSVAHAVQDEDFCDRLMAALVAIAGKSKRRQADLSAALCRHRLAPSSGQVSSALARLEAAGCIREIVPLYDGGTLVTVTNLGMDLLGRSAHWRFLQDLSHHAE